MPPRKRARVERYPCVVCKDKCAHGSIQCDACRGWIHAECDGFDSKDLPAMYYININYVIIQFYKCTI